MEILTITCERDIHDLKLQIHSMEQFIEEPCVHMVAIEDGSKSHDEWLDILAPLYNKHSLRFFWFDRPDLDFTKEFVGYNPGSKNGIGGLGWRRQQILKLQMTAQQATSSSVLVLDSKNIFVNSIKLDNWPVKHGNGKYLSLSEIDFHPVLGTIRNWVYHLNKEYGLSIPKKFAMILETPFVWQTDIVKKMWNEYDIPSMFLNPEVMPNSEFHMYFFFVDENDLDLEQDSICRVLMWNPTNIDYVEFVQTDINYCDQINSPTHGLHRQTREDMSEKSADIYEKWLTNKGLDAKLVNDYMTWCL